jgi:hypothetical protein
VRDPNPEVHRRIAELLEDGWRPDLTVVPPLWRMANGQTLVMYRRHEKAIRAGHGDERPDYQLTSLVDQEPELDSLDEVAPPLPSPAELARSVHEMLGEFATFAADWPERTIGVMRAAAQVLQGGPVPDGLGIDPIRGGPDALGKLLDDHADAVEYLLHEHRSARPLPWWDLYARLLLVVEAGLARLARWIDSCRPRPDRLS